MLNYYEEIVACVDVLIWVDRPSRFAWSQSLLIRGSALDSHGSSMTPVLDVDSLHESN